MKSRLSPAQQREALEGLRRAYEQELPAKIEAIARAVPDSQAEGYDAAALDGFYHLAHRLAGSAAIYGFEEVRRAAAGLEALAMSAIEGHAKSGPALRDGLSAGIARLRQAIHKPSADPGNRR
jgi:HPt (histidine-containing phosphotransfer) domain-containing protein